MAWALRFDGVNDYATLSLAAPQSGYFTAEIVPEFGSLSDGNYKLYVRNDNSGGRPNWYINLTKSSGVTTAVSLFADVTTVNFTPIDVSSAFNIDLTSDSSTREVSLTINGTVAFTNTTVFDGRLSYSSIIAIAGAASRSLPLLLKTYEYGSYTTAGGKVQTAFLDATASSHAAGTPILTDTIGGNNATGVNMPTDGSAWVDLGGGGTTGAITQTAESFTQSASGSVTVIGFTGAITQTAQSFTQSLLGAIGYTGSISQTVQSFTQSAIGTALTAISGEINQTVQSFTQSAIGVTVLNLTGTITQTSSAFTQSAAGLVIVPISGVINQTVSSFTMSAAGRIPVQWVDKLPASTSWTTQTETTTTWTDQAGVSTIWTDKV